MRDLRKLSEAFSTGRILAILEFSCQLIRAMITSVNDIFRVQYWLLLYTRTVLFLQGGIISCGIGCSTNIWTLSVK